MKNIPPPCLLHLGWGVFYLACYMESGGKFRNPHLARSLALGKIHPGRGVYPRHPINQNTTIAVRSGVYPACDICFHDETATKSRAICQRHGKMYPSKKDHKKSKKKKANRSNPQALSQHKIQSRASKYILTLFRNGEYKPTEKKYIIIIHTDKPPSTDGVY